MFENTCILLFSRSAKEEARHKRLHHSDARNQLIHKKLHIHCSKILAKSNLDFLIYDEKKQKGANFAEKITHAISAAFEQYDKLIIVGSDCPELTVVDIHNAANALEESKQVVGLEKKGGSYLIGLQKSIWNPALFQQLEWNTKDLGEQLTCLLKEHSTLVFLERKTDINRLSDLKLSSFIVDVKRLITSILSTLQNGNIGHFFSKKLDFIYIQNPISFRGPPVIIY